MSFAILIGREVKPCNMMTWARWFEATSKTKGEHGLTARHVGDDSLDGLRVSTVFLGLDHQHGSGPPLWFETMTFADGGTWEAIGGLTQRYSTYEQAEQGHAYIVGLVGKRSAVARANVSRELQRIATLTNPPQA